MKNSRTFTVVSNADSLIPAFCNDSWVVVKLYREAECLDIGNGSEDSDCESDSEQAGKSAPQEQDDRKKGSGREPLPVLVTGSFAR